VRSPLPTFTPLVGLAVLAAGCAPRTLDAGHDLPGLGDNLIGHWRLDDGTGSTAAQDSSGRGNHGVLHGLNPASAWVAGRSQQALQTTRAGWVQVSPSPSIDSIISHVTLSGWIDLEDGIRPPDIWGTALSRQIGTSIDQHYHLSLFMDRRPHLFFTTITGYVLLSAPDPVPSGVWIHLAGTYDGAMARLYVDGVEVASQTMTGNFAPDATPVLLGGNGNDASGVPTELFPGRIDELMLYARALSAREIGELAAGAAFPGGVGDGGN
jgi:beta-galactosidase